jgi:metal-sulfur cluster biosynthetic enzyme
MNAAVSQAPPADLPEIAGDGPFGRRRAAAAELERIVDPCSASFGHPIGLVGMGMIERLDVRGGTVAVLLLPTFPNCMFRGVFEEEIEKRLLALPWCRRATISFCPADRTWDESRLSASARRALGRGTRHVADVGTRQSDGAAP